jgi:hypothetical protein
VPSGTVQFKVDGSFLGGQAGLTNGIATFSTSALSHGVHAITAEYTGDGNFLGSTNLLPISQLINTPPLAQMAAYSRYIGSSLRIPIADLLTNYTSDVDGDAVALVTVGSGTNGANIYVLGDSIYYDPSSTDVNRNTTDYFDYSVNDGFVNGLATNKVQISLSGVDPASQPPVLENVSMMADRVLVRFTGVPNCSYRVQRAATLAGNVVWNELGSTTSDSVGQAEFSDLSPLPNQAFYRAVWSR